MVQESAGYKSMLKTKWMTLAGAGLTVMSSTVLYINAIGFLVGVFLVGSETPFWANPYLNMFVFGVNLDSVLNDVGMFLVCGVLKTVSCTALTTYFSAYFSTARDTVVPLPQPVFDSQAYEVECSMDPALLPLTSTEDTIGFETNDLQGVIQPVALQSSDFPNEGKIRSVFENGDTTVNQAGQLEDDTREEQRVPCPVQMEHSNETSTDTDDKRGGRPIDITHDEIRNGSLPPVEDLEMQNVLSQGQPNMIGVVANLKINVAKRKPKVKKMPSVDRNFESLTPVEIAQSGV